MRQLSSRSRTPVPRAQRAQIDPGQLEITGRLFHESSEQPDRFHEHLREIEELLGTDELVNQLQLLADYTCHEVEELLALEAEEPEAEVTSLRPSPRWALTVMPKQCQKILHREKVWEIRGQSCKKHLRERICIAESGSGMLVGEMTIRESIKVTREELEANVDLHQIEDLSILRYSNIYAWVIEDVVAYPERVPHKGSRAAWVDLQPAPRRAECCNESCRFGLKKHSLRGAPYTRPKDGVSFEHCFFCSAEAFESALKEQSGQQVKRYLTRQAKADPERHLEALQRIRDMRGENMVKRFASQGAGRKAKRESKPIASWNDSLAFRQPALRESDAAHEAFRVKQQKQDARLQKKFPSIYQKDAREEACWAPARSLAFRKWCLENSWRMCSCCGRMVPQVFRASHATGTATKSSELPACGHCKSGGAKGYWAPSPEDVPRPLRKLSSQVIEALRPFDIHTGGVFRPPNGYLVHNDMMTFSFKKSSVEENLAKLSRRQRKRGEKALEYLLQSSAGSHYHRFWQLHHRFLRKRARAIARGEIWAGASVKRLPTNFIETVGLECALWPHPILDRRHDGNLREVTGCTKTASPPQSASGGG